MAYTDKFLVPTNYPSSKTHCHRRECAIVVMYNSITSTEIICGKNNIIALYLDHVNECAFEFLWHGDSMNGERKLALVGSFWGKLERYFHSIVLRSSL